MATEKIINEFHKGEYVEITFFGKDRDGSVLTTPASQVITLTLASTAGGAPAHEWSTTTGHITLVDEPTGEWKIALTPTDLAGVDEGAKYYFNIWSELSAETPLLQAKGLLILGNSIEPA